MSPESAHLFSKKVKNLIIVQNNIFILQHRSTTFHFLLTKAHIESFFSYHIDINKTVLASTSQPISTFWYNNQQQNFILKASLLNFQEYRSCLYDHAMMTAMRAENGSFFFLQCTFTCILCTHDHDHIILYSCIHCIIHKKSSVFVRTHRNDAKKYNKVLFTHTFSSSRTNRESNKMCFSNAMHKESNVIVIFFVVAAVIFPSRKWAI